MSYLHLDLVIYHIMYKYNSIILMRSKKSVSFNVYYARYLLQPNQPPVYI